MNRKNAIFAERSLEIKRTIHLKNYILPESDVWMEDLLQPRIVVQPSSSACGQPPDPSLVYRSPPSTHSFNRDQFDKLERSLNYLEPVQILNLYNL